MNTLFLKTNSNCTMETSNQQQLTFSSQIHCLFKTHFLRERLSLFKTLQEEQKTLNNNKKKNLY